MMLHAPFLLPCIHWNSNMWKWNVFTVRTNYALQLFHPLHRQCVVAFRICVSPECLH